MLVRPENEKLVYSGRIDWDNQEEPIFVYPCSSIGMKFTGNTLKVKLKNRNAYWDNYLGCILDGKQTKILIPQEGEAEIEIPVSDTENHIHDIAQGGIALMDKTGWFYEPEAVGMETAWDKIHYNPMFENTKEWDFSQYTPQVVIVAIGQNDSHPNDYMKEDYHGEEAEKWRTHYKEFLKKLRNQYPEAYIICCTTLLCHDENWDNSIGQVVEELNDEKITRYLFRRNGKGTPGHLRIPEAEEMAEELAEELAAYIERLDIERWD